MSGASVIDRALLGADFAEDVTLASLGGRVVRMRVLSPSEVKALGVEIGGITEPSGGASEKAMRSRVLHAVCSLPDGSPLFASPALARRIPSGMARELWRAYERMHSLTHTVTGPMQREMRSLARSPEMWIERLRAAHAAGLVAFFGLPSALDATTAQILWFNDLVGSDS